MAKRVLLFLAVNFLIVITISLLTAVLGLQPFLANAGIDYGQLMILCLLWGMGGAFISLALSRVMAKWMMGVQVIDPSTHDPHAQALVQRVSRLARGANLPMPEVGVYESPDLNAFATGPTRSRALVAVSTGLLQRLDDAEVDGVLGHEITHVANGDMVTMTLLQGVVNAFVMFFARVIAWAIVSAGRRSDDDRSSAGSAAMAYMITFVLEMVFMILGSMVIMAFSRWREFRADAGGARLAGRQNMIAALQALRRDVDTARQVSAAPAVAAFRISNPGGMSRLFMSHPPLEERITRLQQMAA